MPCTHGVVHVQRGVDRQHARLEREEPIHLELLEHVVRVQPARGDVDDVAAAVVAVHGGEVGRLGERRRVPVDASHVVAEVDAVERRDAPVAVVERRMARRHQRGEGVDGARVGRDAHLPEARGAEHPRLRVHPARVEGAGRGRRLPAEEHVEQRPAQEVLHVRLRLNVVERGGHVVVRKFGAQHVLAHELPEHEGLIRAATVDNPHGEHCGERRVQQEAQRGAVHEVFAPVANRLLELLLGRHLLRMGVVAKTRARAKKGWSSRHGGWSGW